MSYRKSANSITNANKLPAYNKAPAPLWSRRFVAAATLVWKNLWYVFAVSLREFTLTLMYRQVVSHQVRDACL